MPWIEVRGAIITIFRALKSLLHDRIQQLLNDAISFNANDNLAHVGDDDARVLSHRESLEYSDEEVSKKLIREVKDEIKEKGVNPLCAAEGLVKLDIRGKVYRTPILLTPVTLHHDKVRSLFRFSICDEPFLNPFLLRTLGIEFNLDARSVETHNIFHWLQEKGFSVEVGTSYIGSFHHHRYAIIRELEELLSTDDYAESLLQIFGEFDGISESWDLANNNLLPADIDHERVFQQVKESCTVVQGPPGTGKTQVLVNLIGKLIHDKRRLTVISEKHVALDVIFKKLDELGLSPLAYIAASEHSNTSFIRSLEEAWKFFEELEIKEPVNLSLSEQHEQRLQLILDTVNKEGLAGGISYTAFLAYFNRFKNDNYTYRSIVPNLDEFEKRSGLIEELFNKELSASVGILKPLAFEQNRLSSLDQKITEWKNELKKLQEYFEIEKWSDLELAMKTAADLQIFENELIKKYASLLEENSKGRKKFEGLYKKWISHPLKDHPLAIPSHWITRPGVLELDDLSERLQGSFFTKRSASKRWKQLSHLPVNKAQEAIAEDKLLRKQEDSFTQLVVKFCELGIESPLIEVDQIKQVMHYFTPEKWQQYRSFNNKERSNFSSFHSALRRLNDELKQYLRLSNEIPIQDQLEQLRTDLGEIISIPEISAFSENTIALISQCNTWREFQADLFHSHKIALAKFYPTLKGFDPGNLEDELNEIIQLQNSESSLFVSEILYFKKRQFEYLQQLLLTPARKLNEEEKTLKQQLKRGKSILVKEFGKTRQHSSLRELFSSEAKYWIQLLKPIWLSNPASLAKSLPLERALFDISIFDESTQIPLQNALGILQRSRRSIVAGDEHQMGPSQYFNSSGTETEDLLHQASYHYHTVMLKHHYRSNYPDLIRFSNKHFYNNELHVYPSPNPPNDVLKHVHVDGGVFIDRRNVPEAKIVAMQIVKKLYSTEKLGIVAFSEEQLSAIIAQLNVDEKVRLEDNIENHGWFCKALENLQGDECDHLFISFAYAKNSDGDFHHRFGPMNLPTGRNRLNVLMTRARSHITLFSSVSSSEFKVSDNESVNLLRQFITYFEKYEPIESAEFPHSLKPVAKDLEVSFQNIYNDLSNARELVTLQRVMKNRAWRITYH